MHLRGGLFKTHHALRVANSLAAFYGSSVFGIPIFSFNLLSPLASNMTTPAATIVNQHRFGRYAQAWVKAASSGKHLPEAFQKDGCERLQYAAFDFQSIVWLVSTVGARRIQAQFVLVPENQEEDGKHTPAYFSIVLYAVDAMGGRISAYYLGNNTFTPSTPATNPSLGKAMDAERFSTDPSSLGGGPVAFDLAKIWLTNWTGQQTITRHLFSSNYGPLQGYTFELDDFMDPLFYSQKFKATQVLHVGFALHEYHAAFPKHDEEALTRTFGLVLRVYGTVETDTTGDALDSKQATWAYATDVYDDGPGQPFYDLSHPYPPGASVSE